MRWEQQRARIDCPQLGGPACAGNNSVPASTAHSPAQLPLHYISRPPGANARGTLTNNRKKLAVVAAARASALMPRTTASAATVCTTNAGSFMRLLTGSCTHTTGTRAVRQTPQVGARTRAAPVPQAQQGPAARVQGRAPVPAPGSGSRFPPAAGPAGPRPRWPAGSPTA
jgi:hypothetical protein